MVDPVGALVAQQLIDLMKEPFLSAMNDAVSIDPASTEHFLTSQISLLEGLPMLGTCCFQACIQRFVVLARSRLQRRLNNPFAQFGLPLAPPAMQSRLRLLRSWRLPLGCGTGRTR